MKKRRGTALLLVLWAMGVVSVAVIGLAQYLDRAISSETNRLREMRADAMAESGLALAMHPLVRKWDSDLLNQNFGSDESFSVSIESEGGRLNINQVLLDGDRDLLVNLFVKWGMTTVEANALFDALFDWIDADDLAGLNGAEQSAYAGSGKPDYPPNRPFASVQEMDLVVGMNRLRELKPDYATYFTVWSSGPLDLNEAGAELIEVTVGVNELQALAFVEARIGRDAVAGTEDDALYLNANAALNAIGVPESQQNVIARRVTVNDTIVRVTIAGRSGTYTTSREAIVARKPEGSVLIRWMN